MGWINTEDWDNPTAPANIRNIIDKGEHNSESAYGLYSYNNKLHFRLNKNTNADVYSTLPSEDEWNHITATYDQTHVRLYINSIIVGEENYNDNILTNSEPLYIGSAVNRDYFFKGVIDDIRIYNRALSTSEIEDNYNGNIITTSGLVSRWKMDDTGGIAYDSQGSNDGNIYGAQLTNYAKHKYTAANTYNVILTVKDNDGAIDSESKMITVTS
jgi:hypothetical protein